MNVFAAPDGLNNPRCPQHAKMFGGVVLGNLDPLGQFADRDWIGKQFLYHSPPGLVCQGLEKWFAASRIGRPHGPGVYNTAAELKVPDFASVQIVGWRIVSQFQLGTVPPSLLAFLRCSLPLPK
jgi:hypothetical protein